MASRLNEHVNEHNLSEVFQSAYKKEHSTESALSAYIMIFYEQLTMVAVKFCSYSTSPRLLIPSTMGYCFPDLETDSE